MEHPVDGHVGHELLRARDLARGPRSAAQAHRWACRTRHTERVPLRRRRRRRDDGVDDLGVARAAAQVAGQGVADVGVVGPWLAAQQRLSLHDDAGRAEAALAGAGRDEGAGPLAPASRGQSLKRQHVAVLEPRRGLRARHDGAAVDDDRARATRPFRRAAVLHRAQPKLVAQHIEQALAVAGLNLDALSVDRESHSVAFAQSDGPTGPVGVTARIRLWQRLSRRKRAVGRNLAGRRSPRETGMDRPGLATEIVDEQVYERAVRRFREQHIVMPTFGQLADPTTIPPAAADDADPDSPDPRNLFRVHWHNGADRRIARGRAHARRPAALADGRRCADHRGPRRSLPDDRARTRSWPRTPASRRAS